MRSALFYCNLVYNSSDKKIEYYFADGTLDYYETNTYSEDCSRRVDYYNPDDIHTGYIIYDKDENIIEQNFFDSEEMG